MSRLKCYFKIIIFTSVLEVLFYYFLLLLFVLESVSTHALQCAGGADVCSLDPPLRPDSVVILKLVIYFGTFTKCLTEQIIAKDSFFLNKNLILLFSCICSFGAVFCTINESC